MSIFRGDQERRWGSEPPIPRNSELGRIQTRTVDVSSAEGAMQSIAVDASISLLSAIVEMLPFHVYTGTGKDKRRIQTPRWLDDLGGDGHGLEDWFVRGQYSWGLRGNIIGKTLERDSTTGKPRQIEMYNPDEVTVRRVEGGAVEWRWRGNVVPTADIFHRRIFPIPGYILGASPIARHALTLGLGRSAEQFGAQFFMDGGHPTAMLKNKEKKLSPEQANTAKKRFLAVIRGNREPLVLGSDWEYQALQVSPNDSQFLSTFDYTDAQTARIFGPGMPEMLGYKTGTGMTYQNIEQRAIDLLTFTADPWLRRFERMISSLLPNPQYGKFERKAFVRTDLLTRFKAHEIALRNEFEVVNEVRELEDLEPVEWGDVPTKTKTAPPIPVQMEV